MGWFVQPRRFQVSIAADVTSLVVGFCEVGCFKPTKVTETLIDNELSDQSRVAGQDYPHEQSLAVDVVAKQVISARLNT